MPSAKPASRSALSHFSVSVATAFCLAAGAVTGASAQDSFMEPSSGAEIAAKIQNTGDAAANRLAADLLRNADFRGATIAARGRRKALAGLMVRPASNGRKPDYKPGKFHTNLRIFIPAEGIGSIRPPSLNAHLAHDDAPPASGLPFNTPASLACVYKLLPSGPAKEPAGCSPDVSTVNPSGGGGAIAVVDAYDTPSTYADLTAFSTQFGLRQAQFQIVYASGHQPESSYTGDGGGWDMESELDVQWAHAMAPYAKIFLVEANSDSTQDLFAAANVATQLVEQNGGGEVSMSFGGSEYQGEQALDSHFVERPGVVYLTSAGDSNIVQYPAASPHVIAVGGTTLFRDEDNSFQGEAVWDDAALGEEDDGGTGGGPSYFEPRPDYQNGISGIVRGSRGTPDVSFDASPDSGVYVLVYGYWYIVGGTSLSSPATAGIVNVSSTLANTRRTNTSHTELVNLYSALESRSYTADFNDIVSGSCGEEVFPPDTPVNLAALPGYDMCSGVGTPLGYAGYGAPAGALPKRSTPFIENGTLTLTRN